MHSPHILLVSREWKMQREKVDFLVAVGEKLCNMDSSTEMQKLEGTNKSGQEVQGHQNLEQGAERRHTKTN